MMAWNATHRNVFAGNISTATPAPADGWYQADSIVLPILRCCTGMAGIIGNLLVCIVVVRLWSSNKRNATNTLIANQAAIDLAASLFLVVVTFTEAFDVPPPAGHFFGQLVCKFWSSRMLLFGVFAASTLNLTAISLERYLAVIHPIFYSMRFARSAYAKWLPIVPWLVGPFWQFIVALIRYEYVPETGQCEYEAEEFTLAMQKIFGLILFLWEYFFPTLIMTYAFFRIAQKFRKDGVRVGGSGRQRRQRPPANLAVATVMTEHQNSVSLVEPNGGRSMENSLVTAAGAAGEAGTSGGASQGPKPSGNIQRRNVTKTLFVVFVVFVICWSPDQWAFLQYNLGGQLDFGGVFVNFAIFTAQLNSCVNPFIYGLQYRAYRQGLRALFCKCAGDQTARAG